MDLLSDVLQQSGIRRRLLDLRHLMPGDSLRFPCVRSMGFHVVTRGRLQLHADDADSRWELGPGDVAVMARGRLHTLSTPGSSAPAAVVDERPARPRGDLPAAAVATVVSGAYQLWNPPLHPLFGALPDWEVLRAEHHDPLSPLGLVISLISREAAQGELGAESALHGLLDAAFAFLLRDLMRRDAGRAAGWQRALRDDAVRTALGLMHAEPAQPWSLEALARAVGLSRTAFAQRFRVALGDTPVSYLRGLRMQRAMRLLEESRRPLQAVAAEVGYGDAFGFSKVFKRCTGVSPAAYRRESRRARGD